MVLFLSNYHLHILDIFRHILFGYVIQAITYLNASKIY